MTPIDIGLCLGLASVAVSAAVGGGVVVLAAKATRAGAWQRLGARTRASVLVQARLAPLTVSLVLVPLVQLAFWRFEPAHYTETTGVVLPLLAAAGACLLGAVGRGVWRSLHATARVASVWRHAGERSTIPGWQGRAWIVQSGSPVVAVVGVRRAELYVSADVVRTCSAREIAAIAAHERAHVAGRDNLTRALFALAPAPGRAARHLERLWSATAEEIADLYARAAGDGVTLAQALVKVARLAVVGAAPPPLAMSTLIGDDSLESRVRRLLEPACSPGPALRGMPALGVLPAALVAVFWGLPTIYEAAEFIVRLGR